MSTINVKYRTPLHLYHFHIDISDELSTVYDCYPLELKPFIYGNDDDIDSVLFPGSVTMEFSLLGLNGANIYSETEYFKLNSAFAFSETDVLVYKDGTEAFRGYVDPKNFKSAFEDRSFTLTVLSNFGKLKEIDPRTLDYNDFFTPPGEDKILYTDLILKLIQVVYPTINQVILMSNVQSETTFTLLGVPWIAGAQYFGEFNHIYIGENSKYEKASDIIKEVCSLFGSVGIVLENKFIMQSRFYYSQTTQVIFKRQFVKDKGPTKYSSQRLDGMQVLVKPNPSNNLVYEEIYGIVEKDENDNVKNSDFVETIVMSTAGGDPPGIDGELFPLLVDNLWIFVPAFVAGIGNEQWTSSVRNSFFITGGTKKPLWKCVADELWTLVSSNRIIYETEVDGLDWAYNKYYTFENSTLKLRPRKISFDDVNDQTKLDLIQG